MNRQAKTCLENEERRGRCPNLGRARDRIKCGSFPWAPFEAAEQLRQSMQVDHAAQIEQAEENLAGIVLESVFRHAAGNQGIVVRPDRTVMVGKWVISDFGRSHGADSPSCKEKRVDESLCKPAGSVC